MLPPPGRAEAVTVPPWAVTVCCTMARPRPEPGARDGAGVVGAVKPPEDLFALVVGDGGAPVQDADLSDRRSGGIARADVDVDGPAGRAEFGGVVEKVHDGTFQRGGMAGDGDRPWGPQGENSPREVGLGETDGFGGEFGQLHRRGGSGRGLGPREVDQVGDKLGQLGGLRLQVGQERGLIGAVEPAVGVDEQVDVGAQAGHGRAQFVRGVLDEIALLLLGRVQAGEHVVERLAELGDLVVPVDFYGPAQVAGFGDAGGRAGEPIHRPQSRAGDEPAGERGDGRGTGDEDGDQDTEALQRGVRIGQ